jgi:hypothetical protein
MPNRTKGAEMVRGTAHRKGRSRLVAVAAWALLALGTTAASAPAGSAARTEANGPYAITLAALTGPQGADLAIAVAVAPGEAPVQQLKKVQLKIFGAADSVPDVRNLRDVVLEQGAVDLQLGQVARGRRIEADVLVQTSPDLPTYVVRGATTTRLRPDVVVAAVYAPPQTTTARPIDVVAEIDEVNGDTPATTARATLMLGPTQLADPVSLSVDAGGHTSVTFSGVRMPTPVRSELSVFVTDVSPAETDDTNNVRTRIVDVTENELVRSTVLVPSLGGYGAQFGDHVYAPISGPPANVTDMEAKAKALEPQLVRIFYNDNWNENADGRHAADWQQNLDSFYRVVGLAQEAGATINISYQNLANAKSTPTASMARFAGVLDYLVRDRGYTNVRWVTVGNEANAGTITPEQWEPIFRALDADLRARGLRDQIKMVGADLVEGTVGGPSDHRVWFKYMLDHHMDTIIDAWSEHIYWMYDTELQKMERRLKDVRELVSSFPPEAQKPTYLWEFGVRGKFPFPDKPIPRYAYYENGQPIREQNVAAFQTLWFFVESAQLGFAGVSKWDAYWAMYDFSSPNNQWDWTIGPPEQGWPLYPMWYSIHLLLATTEPGWQVLQVAPWQDDDWKQRDDAGNPLWDQQEKELVAYAGSSEQLTVVGLDTHGRLLNTVSDQSPEYSIGGLPPNTTFNLALWNATGDGKNTVGSPVTTNAVGVARFAVPLQAAFSLTTLPVS